MQLLLAIWTIFNREFLVGRFQIFFAVENHFRIDILALAVASGSAVFLFKSLRPYYKFVLPQMEIAQVEKDVWLKAREVISLLFLLLENRNRVCLLRAQSIFVQCMMF